MSKFFISPITNTDLDVSPENLKMALVARWPGARIEDISEGNRLFTWVFVAPHGLLDGYLNRKRQVVVLEGDVRDCAEFAQWYRSLVDAQYELSFYDDSYSNSIPVTGNTAIGELVSPWL